MQRIYNAHSFPMQVEIRQGNLVVAVVEVPPESSAPIPIWASGTFTPLTRTIQIDHLYNALLSEEQCTSLAIHGYIEVKSRLHYGITYHVPNGYGAVKIWWRKHQIASACLVPAQELPKGDYLFVRLLLLEGDERAFLRQAFISFWPRSDGRPRTGVDWITFYQQATP